jgi:ribose 5-phosphate isomerase
VSIEREKQLAAMAAAELVEDGMRVGLGTGSTVWYLLPALAARGLDLRCVSTSPATEHAARDLGIHVEAFSGADALPRLDIAIDGADQVAPSGWVVKGGGAAHTREKAVAAAAERFVVIVSSDKIVERLSPPVPLELMVFGLGATWRPARTEASSPTTRRSSTILKCWRGGSPRRSVSSSTGCSRRPWCPTSWSLGASRSRDAPSISPSAPSQLRRR